MVSRCHGHGVTDTGTVSRCHGHGVTDTDTHTHAPPRKVMLTEQWLTTNDAQLRARGPQWAREGAHGTPTKLASVGDDSSANANWAGVRSGAVHSSDTLEFPFRFSDAFTTTRPSSLLALTTEVATVTNGGLPAKMVTLVEAEEDLVGPRVQGEGTEPPANHGPPTTTPRRQATWQSCQGRVGTMRAACFAVCV
jgi:hypothetical protein